MKNFLIIFICIQFFACKNESNEEIKKLKNEYQLVFVDDFNGQWIDSTKWTSKSKNPKPFDRILPRGNCNYTNAAVLLDSNIVLANGHLNLIAKQEQYNYSGIVEGETNKDIGCGFLGKEAFNLKQDYTSASISAISGYNHGYFECRAKIPSTKGLYPVLWFWHHDEIVIFEFFGDSKKHFVSSHNKNDYLTKEFQHIDDYSDDFHIYAVYWTANSVTWYLDHQKIWSINRSEDFDVKSNRNVIPDSLDRWLTPNISLRIYEWANYVDNSNLPDTLKVDYLKIYQKK